MSEPTTKAGQRLAAELQVAYRIDLILAIEAEERERCLRLLEEARERVRTGDTLAAFTAVLDETAAAIRAG